MSPFFHKFESRRRVPIHFDPNLLFRDPRDKDLPPIPPLSLQGKPTSLMGIAQSSRTRQHNNPLPPLKQPTVDGRSRGRGAGGGSIHGEEINFQTGDSFLILGVSGEDKLFVQSLLTTQPPGWITSHPSFIQIYDSRTKRHITHHEFYSDLIFHLRLVAGNATRPVVDFRFETPGQCVGGGSDSIEQERYMFKTPRKNRIKEKGHHRNGSLAPPQQQQQQQQPLGRRW